jgi:CheY-like chemotaxis protein
MSATVLVVDDDVVTRTAIAALLEDQGLTVLTAGDGREAMAIFAAEPAQLVITDIFMPNMDGIELIIALRGQFWIPKVVAISGGGQQCGMDVLHMARLLGADATLAKPVVPTRLARLARDLLQQADVEAAAARRITTLRPAA